MWNICENLLVCPPWSSECGDRWEHARVDQDETRSQGAIEEGAGIPKHPMHDDRGQAWIDCQEEWLVIWLLLVSVQCLNFTAIIGIVHQYAGLIVHKSNTENTFESQIIAFIISLLLFFFAVVYCV